MQRREFLLSSCNICLLGAAGFVLPQLTGCSAAKTTTSVFKASIINNQLNMPLDMFASNSLQIVRPTGWFFDIAVQKKADNTYSAMLMQCTHQENQLDVTGNGFSCSLHGSQFDKNGAVTKGPAEEHLQRYKTTINNNSLIIEVPKQP